MLVPARATPKPSWRFARSSMVTSDTAESVLLEELEPRAHGDGQLQAADEHGRAEDRQADREPQDLLRLELAAAQARAHHQGDAGEEHARQLEHDAEEADGAQNPEERDPVELVDGLALRRSPEGKGDDRDPDRQKDQAE